MLGRRDLEEDKHRVSSSSSSPSPPVTPTDQLMRPAALKSQRSARSESFKALLLRKGSRPDSSSRISAVERLRKVVSPTAAADLHGAPPPHISSDQVNSTSSLQTGETHDITAHLTLNVQQPPRSPCAQSFSMMLEWRQQDLPHNNLFFSSSSSSPFFFLSSSSTRPRSLTPPCSASRRFAARCRLVAAPMTAIFEGEDEEEDEEDFNESSGADGESSLTLVETAWWTRKLADVAGSRWMLDTTEKLDVVMNVWQSLSWLSWNSPEAFNWMH